MLAFRWHQFLRVPFLRRLVRRTEDVRELVVAACAVTVSDSELIDTIVIVGKLGVHINCSEKAGIGKFPRHRGQAGAVEG